MIMPRLKNKATKIAWSILGVPLAMKKPQKTAKQKYAEKFMNNEETQRVR